MSLGAVEALHDAGAEVAIIDISENVEEKPGSFPNKGPPFTVFEQIFQTAMN